MKRRSEKGFSVVELLIAVAIMAVVGVAFFQSFRSAVSAFRTGTDTLSVGQTEQTPLAPMLTRLQGASGIRQLSLMSEPSGFVEYESVDGQIIKLFLNTTQNQSRFVQNPLPKDALVVMFTTSDGATSDPEPLIKSVSSFQVVSYSEDPRYFRLASPNNMVAGVDFDEISSLKLVVDYGGNDPDSVITHLVELSRSRISRTGSLHFGFDVSEADSQFPFVGRFSQQSFTLSGLTRSIDLSAGSIEADGLHLDHQSLPVKIRNTGQYFSTIQAAINAAVASQDILVSGGTYQESLRLKSGVRLYGGYDRETWKRDLSRFPTTIQTRSGIEHTTVFVASNSSIDGFRIDGLGLLFGFLAQNVSEFKVSNCEVFNVDRAFFIQNSTGDLTNNSVTANRNSVFVSGSSGLQLIRNRLFSTNAFDEANIHVLNSTSLKFFNNAVIGGEFGFDFTGSPASFSSAEIVNNVITKADDSGIIVFFTDLQLFNNVIFDHSSTGVLVQNTDPAPVITMRFNVLGDNPNANVFGGVNVDATNQQFNQVSNQFFDLGSFTLSGASSLIDRGNTGVAFSDKFFTGNGFVGPGKGGSTNDIGIYGGPLAGRLGVGQTHRLSPGSITGSFSQVFPGDYVVLDKGAFTAGNVIVVDDVSVMGAGPQETVVQCTSGSGCFAFRDNTFLQDLTIDGNSQTGVVVNGAGGCEISSVLFLNSSIAIDVVSPAETVISHCTFSENGVGVNARFSGSAAVLFSIFDRTSGAALQAVGGSITSEHTLFSGNGSRSSGSVTLSNAIDTSPQFWDSDNGLFYLKPSSSAVDRFLSRDLGCFEFFKLSGSFTSPDIDHNIHRLYDEIEVHVSGNAGEIPGNLDNVVSELTLFVLSDDAQVTLSPSVIITGNAAATFKWSIPPTVITRSLKLKGEISSFVVGKTPYINAIDIEW